MSLEDRDLETALNRWFEAKLGAGTVGEDERATAQQAVDGATLALVRAIGRYASTEIEKAFAREPSLR